MADIEDLERVRSALRAGAQPVQVEMRDTATRRALQPAVIAYEADGGVLELAKNGWVTRLGRLWDQERERANRGQKPRALANRRSEPAVLEKRTTARANSAQTAMPLSHSRTTT